MSNENLDKIREINAKKSEVETKDKQHKERLASSASLEHVLFESFQSLVSVIEGSGKKGEAIGLIVNALDKLDKASELNKSDVSLVKAGLTELEKQLKDIPADSLKQLPKFLQQREVIKVTNLDELDKGFKQVESAIKGMKLDVQAPKVTVKASDVKMPAPIVNIPETDLKPLQGSMLDLLKAIKGIKIPKQERVDLTKLEKESKTQTKLLKEIKEKPVGGGGGGGQAWTATNPAGTPMPLNLDADGNLKVTSTGGGGGSGTQYAELNTTAPATGTVALARYKSSAPTLTDGQLYAPQLDASGNLKVAGSFSSTPPTDVAPATQNITVVDSASSSAAGANNQTIIIGNPTAGSAASFALSTIETIRVEVTGIWTGTIATETSIDGGTTWVNQGIHQGAYTTSSFTMGFVGGANVAGATNFRVRATAAITGTAVVKVIESVNTQSVYIANAAPAGNVISILNSSTATLTAGSTYTGTGEDVSNFSEMRVSVIASHASGTDGLSIQQSSNNTNWDIIDTYTIPATTGKTFVVPRQARYFRIVYTNGGTNQSSFRLQAILNRTATSSSSQRAQDGYSNENDLEQVWAFNSFFNGTTHDLMRGDTTNGLDVDVTRSVLPTGAATAANQLPNNHNVVVTSAPTTAVTGTFFQATQPVSLTTNTPTLQSGSTTAVTQATAANLNATVVGTGTFAVQAAEADGANVTLGSKADAKNTATDTTAITIMQVLKQISASVQAPPSQAVTNAGTFAVQATLGTGSNVIGKVSIDQTTPGTTNLVALAANQSVNTAQVNGATVNVGTGAAGTGTQRVTTSTDSTIGTVTTLTGTTTLTPGGGATNLGKVEDAAHTTGDTGVFALAVRNDNAATSTTNANTDYSQISTDITGTVFVRQSPSNTPTLANVAASATSVTALAANAARRSAIFYNDSTSDCYIKYGTTASATSFSYYLPSLGTLSIDGNEYAGRVDVIHLSATGNLRVTETAI